MKPKTVLNTCNTRTNNVMRLNMVFGSQSKDTSVTIHCQSTQN